MRREIEREEKKHKRKNVCVYGLGFFLEKREKATTMTNQQKKMKVEDERKAVKIMSFFALLKLKQTIY